MKLFPTKIITISFRNDRVTILNELRRNTKLTGKLASDYTGKEFIGQVHDGGFKIISSEIGRGAVCVFIGDLQDAIAVVEIRIHNAFKVLFSILLLLPLVGFVISIMTQGIEKSLVIIAPMFIAILFIRFVFIELSFRFISKAGFNKLTKIISAKVNNSTINK